MWRHRRPGCVQLVMGAVFLSIVLISVFYARLSGNPNRATMGIYTEREVAFNDFNAGAAGFTSDYFVPENGRYVGTAPPDVGHVLAIHTRSLGNTFVQAVNTDADLPSDGAVSTGVVCRATSTGTGYYFLLASTGRASIRVGVADEPDLQPLLDWQDVSAMDPTLARNTIEAACIEDYLAMYVNGELVGEIYDDTHERGRVGLALATGEQPASVSYDNFAVWQATARQ